MASGINSNWRWTAISEPHFHAPMWLLGLLVVPLMAGCLGADGAPSADDACDHCADPPPATTVALGDVTWDQPEGRPGRVYEEDIVRVPVPDGIRHVLVEVTREHTGHEKTQAHLSVRVREDQMGGRFTFRPAGPLSADRESHDMGFGWGGHESFELRYQYEAQAEPVAHTLRFEITGYT